MRLWRLPLFRISMVVALGAGLAGLAASPDRPKTFAREKPAPIVLATAMLSEVPDDCLLPPRAQGDERPIGDSAGKRSHKKIVACG